MDKKPGVIIYFDILGLVRRLSNEDAGILFRAILEYGENGTVCELPDMLYVLWPMIQMRLDSDDSRYRQVTQKRKYAIYTRWARFHNEEPLPYADWLVSLDRDAEEDMLLPQ